MKQRQDSRVCPYCRGLFKNRELTVDHVPPRGLFGILPPKTNLITVRYCKPCHDGTSLGDEELKALIGMGVLRSQHVTSLREELDRSLDLRPKWAKDLVAMIELGKMKEVALEDGQSAFAVTMTPDTRQRIFNSIRRATIAIFYKHDWKWDHRDTRLRVQWKGDELLQATRTLIAKFPPWQFGREVLPGRFEYAWSAFEDPRYRFMLMIFYGGPAFWVIVEPLEDPQPVITSALNEVFGEYFE